MNETRGEAELLGLHDRFCSAFASRDAAAILATVTDRPDLVVVTSEDALLQGPAQLEAFLDQYAAGPTTYSWSWDRREASVSEGFGLLLAVGKELAVSGDQRVQTPYRMTVVAAPVDGAWAIVQVHGSSPHDA
ncbi:MAG: nuclear transport factor 2 family protein [Solirubrobacterales bacterium]|nr:nuclear transport factor 2 family protein [Solirubrobacterales bacterium]